MSPSGAATAAAVRAGSLIRAVNWHNTPESRRDGLRREVAWYLERYEPIGPEDLDRFTDTGRWHLSRPGIVLAFYDGYRNHATVAGPVCDDLGATAWFFPPTGLLDVAPGDQEAWADGHDVDLLDEERGRPPIAMTADDIAELSRRHVVAAHTASHFPAAQCLTAADAEREVLAPVRLLAEITGRRPPAFAWLMGAAFDPTGVAGRAMLDAGIRYAVSNTAYQRIA